MTLYELIYSLASNEELDADTQLTICGDNNSNIFKGNCADAAKSKIHILYGNRNVVSWNNHADGCLICIEGERFRDDQKFYFKVLNSSDEGSVSGKVKLTFAQALAVDYATSTTNWEDCKEDEYGVPSFFICLDSAVPVED